MLSAIAIRARQPYSPYRTRLAGAMTFSLLVHALLVSLQFGIPGIGLPTLELPWRDRRAQAVDLNVVLANAAKAAPAAEAKPTEAPVADPAHTTPLPAGAPLKLYSSPDALRPAPPAPAAAKKTRARKSPAQPIARRQPARPKKETPVIALNDARKNAFSVPAPAVDEAMPETASEYEPPTPTVASAEPTVTNNPPPPAGEDPAALEREQAALKRAEEEQAKLAHETAARQQREAAERQAQEQEARRKDEESARRQAEAAVMALQQAAQQQEEMRKQEQRLALERDARRQAEEDARHEAALALQKQAEAQQRREQDEAEKVERALELAAKQREEARRRETEKAEREAVELQARKQAEEARQQAAMRERERERQRQAEELAAKEKERAQELAAHQKAEAEAATARGRDPELVLGNAPPSGSIGGAERPANLAPLPRNITGGGLAGRALDQARRPDVLRNDAPAARQQDGLDNPRRRTSIFGNADKDVGLMMYVESWRLKIERNGALNYQPSSADKAQRDPVVTVAIRSDGSVEDIVVHQTSGRPELDEAVRRIVRINARYSAFPPELARRYDVIEIRRAWNFDDRLRIMEEVR